MRVALTGFGAGLLFGLGLWVSGMTDPRNVIGFLDVSGHWNPTLAAVMAGATGVHALALRLRRDRSARSARSATSARSARSARSATSTRSATSATSATAALGTVGRAQVDARLVIGSAVFGVGWGLAGYCPGPAIVSLGLRATPAWGFVAAMIVGVWLAEGTRSVGVARPREAPSC